MRGRDCRLSKNRKIYPWHADPRTGGKQVVPRSARIRPHPGLAHRRGTHSEIGGERLSWPLYRSSSRTTPGTFPSEKVNRAALASLRPPSPYLGHPFQTRPSSPHSCEAGGCQEIVYAIQLPHLRTAV